MGKNFLINWSTVSFSGRNLLHWVALVVIVINKPIWKLRVLNRQEPPPQGSSICVLFTWISFVRASSDSAEGLHSQFLLTCIEIIAIMVQIEQRGLSMCKTTLSRRSYSNPSQTANFKHLQLFHSCLCSYAKCDVWFHAFAALNLYTCTNSVALAPRDSHLMRPELSSYPNPVFQHLHYHWNSFLWDSFCYPLIYF
jgi:hypothetical protein